MKVRVFTVTNWRLPTGDKASIQLPAGAIDFLVVITVALFDISQLICWISTTVAKPQLSEEFALKLAVDLL
jgi:hypothetical protein